MNEPSPASVLGFKDRSTGLTLFGVATTLLGGLSLLLIPLLLLAQSTAGQTTGFPPNYGAMVLLAGMCGGLAVVLVWLGIGSMMARRWARTLLLLVAGSGLVVGLTLLALMAVLLPLLMETVRLALPPDQPPIPEDALAVMMGLMMVLVGTVFVVLPGVWTLFYRSADVQATCEARDPVERWTDRCPLPVLTICAWLAVSVPMILLMPVMEGGGTLVSHVPGLLVCLILAATMGYAAWAMYRLDPRGWWITLISFTGLTVWSAINYRHDPKQMYRLLGVPEEQMGQMPQFGMLSAHALIILSVLFEGLLVGSLLQVKKHFRRAKDI